MAWYWWGKDRESGKWVALEKADGSFIPIGPKVYRKKQKTEFRPRKSPPHDLPKSPFWSELRLAEVTPNEEVHDRARDQS